MRDCQAYSLMKAIVLQVGRPVYDGLPSLQFSIPFKHWCWCRAAITWHACSSWHAAGHAAAATCPSPSLTQSVVDSSV